MEPWFDLSLRFRFFLNWARHDVYFIMLWAVHFRHSMNMLWADHFRIDRRNVTAAMSFEGEPYPWPILNKNMIKWFSRTAVSHVLNIAGGGSEVWEKHKTSKEVEKFADCLDGRSLVNRRLPRGLVPSERIHKLMHMTASRRARGST